MNTGIAIACIGVAVCFGAGAGLVATHLWSHEVPKSEDRVLPKSSQTFGPPPQIAIPVPEMQSTLTHDALIAKGRELAATPAPELAVPSEPPVVKVVHHRTRTVHRRHRTRSSTRRLKSKWVQASQPAPSFSLERLFQ